MREVTPDKIQQMAVHRDYKITIFITKSEEEGGG
jgi:hypothetical protein